MPQVTIKTGMSLQDGREEVLLEYLCDWKDCPNVAEHVMGVVRELGSAFVVCPEHAAAIALRASHSANSARPIG